MRHVTQFHGMTGLPTLQLADDASDLDLVIRWAHMACAGLRGYNKCYVWKFDDEGNETLVHEFQFGHELVIR